MTKAKQPVFEVMSPDADGWNQILDRHVTHHNLENQLKMVMSVSKTPRSSVEDKINDIQGLLDEKLNADTSSSISHIRKKEYPDIEFNPEKEYFAVVLITYNPSHRIADAYQFSE